MKLFVIAAHPDDEILGCGGTVARLVRDGYEAYALILGEGVTSRGEQRDIEKRKEKITGLEKQAEKANRILGVKKVFFFDFPDNRFDTVPFLDIVKIVEKLKKELCPDVVFTHYEKDLNIDHQIAYKATITATRPSQDETVREIYSFETLSSTEWSYPLSFSPNTFFDISDTINLKLKALEYYKSEIKNFLHPRSLEGVKLNAKVWGMKVGLKYAEAFRCIRWIG